MLAPRTTPPNQGMSINMTSTHLLSINWLWPAYSNQKAAVLQLLFYSDTRKRRVLVNFALFKLDIFLLAVSAQKNSADEFLVWVDWAVKQRAILHQNVIEQKKPEIKKVWLLLINSEQKNSEQKNSEQKNSEHRKSRVLVWVDSSEKTVITKTASRKEAWGLVWVDMS